MFHNPFEQTKITEKNYNREMLYRYEFKVETSEDDGVDFLVIQFNKDLKTFKFVQKIQLTRLYIDYCQNVIIDPAPTNVTDLTIYKCGLSKLDGIKKMIQLTHLTLNDNTITDISELRYLVNLKQLIIDENQIEDITSIAYLKKVEYLDMCSNKIRDLQPLSKLSVLENLRLSNNQIVNLFPLQFLFGLQVIELMDNKIIHIESLTNLVGLTLLYLSKNMILDMSPLNAHPNKKEYMLEHQAEIPPTQIEILYSRKYQSIMETSDYLKHVDYLQNQKNNSFAELKNKFSKVVAETTQKQIDSTRQIAQLLSNFNIDKQSDYQ
ncbi:Conserved_hypothetical protein [Hexamita inflata]|uniref:Uncharacterized protein n=1 Tax=Hexamita inflata TaxID=28002 RepID=A0AA86RIR6_9EUKA|nr:Conserved hypothetical protein [Hexamita inflata]